MRRLPVIVTLLLLGLIQTALAGDPPTAGEVLDRFVSAVGGREALEELDLRRTSGTIVQDLSWTDPRHQETPFVAEAHASGRLLYAESRDWADLPTDDTGEPRRKLRWIFHPRFALVVEEYFPGLEVRGREVRDGREVIVLAPRDLPFEHYSLYFDVQTGLLNHVGYHNDLEDWHDVGGVLMPRRWVFGRRGGHTTYHFEEVVSGPAIRSH